MKNRRKLADRRHYNAKQDREYPCNRRVRPCRRLNNISAKWLSEETLIRHPVIWLTFRKAGLLKKTDDQRP
jgi:hypothetical protein